ncbi:MAG: (2Fe-2S)-binding protein [Neisseriaceae bacterium]|nr:(2Fe-2S)-binding protein [Neisseriaceae bacterium]
MNTIAKGEHIRLSLSLNGQQRQGTVEARTLLSDFIRQSLGATGTHVGCEHGVCGACTVLINGVAQRACLILAVQSAGQEVHTVESLAQADGQLNDLQAAFKKHHALQCGFCTAGILMSCTDYLARVSQPTEQDVRDMLSGHICRCTGYTPIVAAVMEVAQQRFNKNTEER